MAYRDTIDSMFERSITRRDLLKRGGAAALGVTFGGSSLAACGGNGEEAADGNGAGEKLSGTLNFWTPRAYAEFTEMFGSSGVLGKPFVQANPGVKLKVRDLQADAHSQSLLTPCAC